MKKGHAFNEIASRLKGIHRTVKPVGTTSAYNGPTLATPGSVSTA